jgi:hypothetical protein
MRALAAACLLALVLAAGASPRDGASRARVDRFDSARAFQFLRWQVALGPRPAGSAASRRLAERLRRDLNGRFQPVPGGLRNVVVSVRGRDPSRFVVVGAHYDTKDLPRFVGANDGAGGTAIVHELARALKPRTVRPTVVFVFFDGEESPRDSPPERFELDGLRGSKVAARVYRRAQAMILLDFVAEKQLSIPRESLSDPQLWARLRAAAQRVGAAAVFPPTTSGAVLDDHVPFLRVGVPSIDLIDFQFACWHQPCDDMTAVSERSVDQVGETIRELLRTL